MANFQDVSVENQRLVSLDVFRGLTVAGMILVNNPGSWSDVYPPLLHAHWHGYTPTDLVFPFFLYIAGVAIPIALGRRLRQGAGRRQLVAKIASRSLAIFVVGLLLNAFPYFELATWRIPGVLQRIAIVYGVCSMLFLFTSTRVQVGMAAAVLVGYCAAMALIPVPGQGAANFDKETNLAAWVDSQLLTGHMWSQSKTWDPEGVLSTAPAIVTGLIGVWVGIWLNSTNPPARKIQGMLLGAMGLLLAGWGWSQFMPINKALWTSSFVLVTAGWATLCLAIIYHLVDVQGKRTGVLIPIAFGMNALFAYVVSSLLARLLGVITLDTSDGSSVTLKSWLFEDLFAAWLPPLPASLAYAVCNVAAVGLLALYLYRHRIFIRL